MRKIAVTGGLSSGKSSVCRFFKEFGAYVVNADEIVHKLLTPNTSTGKQVVALLGSSIITEGKIDRSKVAGQVFQDSALLKALEAILHPAVREETLKQYHEAQASGVASLFVAEIPLLFETGANTDYDYTICVVAGREESLKRFQQTTGYGEEEFQRRMQRQLSPEEKSARADIVISNNGSLEDLWQAVTDIYHQLNPSM